MRDPLFDPILSEYHKGRLILANARFSYVTAVKVAQLLMTHPIIRYADLSGCCLCRNSLNIITYALQFNHSLNHLNLGHNDIDDISLQFVIELLKKRSVMATLNLNHNSISDKGVSLLLDALRRCRVYFLDLSFNRIENTGMLDIAEFAQTCSSLVYMNLRWSGIDSTGIAALANACLFNRSITGIHLMVEDSRKITAEKVVTGLANFNCKLYKEFIGSVFALGITGLHNMSLWQLRGFYSNIEMALSKATDLVSVETTRLSIALENIQSFFKSKIEMTYQHWLSTLILGMPTAIYPIIAGYMLDANPFLVSVTVVSRDNISTSVMLNNDAEVPNFSVHAPLVQVKRFTSLCYENDEKVSPCFH